MTLQQQVDKLTTDLESEKTAHAALRSNLESKIETAILAAIEKSVKDGQLFLPDHRFEFTFGEGVKKVRIVGTVEDIARDSYTSIQQLSETLAQERSAHAAKAEATEAIDTPEYELEVIMDETRGEPRETCVSRFDGLRYDKDFDADGNLIRDTGEFIFHEQIQLRECNGYSESIIRDYFIGAVDRAVNPTRLGTIHRHQRDIGQRKVLINEIPCANMPPFHPTVRLEIVVRAIPGEV